MYSVILASGSPRRSEILEQVGIEFSVISSAIEEISTKNIPEEIVLELATMKAKDVAGQISEASIIIGADTMVALNGQVMGKPKDEEDAKDMLRKIQGKKHQVYTGVCVIIKEINRERNKKTEQESEKIISFTEKTEVWVYPMTEEQIEAYVRTGEPVDKAGAYGIQGKFAAHIEKIEGDYFNIVGFPVARFYQTLRKEGILL
ncbi:MAG: maf protein [Anaerocolumna sp.]|jgi:septum formation protein|nr:maf protein [Anaerocolumna sp.]